MNVLADTARFLAYHLLPRESLARRLAACFAMPGFKFQPEFSGRVAILKLARHFLAAGHRPVALLPDYLCNVVEVAVRKAGFDILHYRTDDLLEPDPTAIVRELQTSAPGLLLTSNMFGSSALLDAMPDDTFRAAVLSSGVAVLVDLCQDISLIHRLPSGYGNCLAAVVSFNDKSFPSVMGGGILAPFPVPPSSKRLACREVLKLYRELGIKLLSATGIVPRRTQARFEYSHCARFPYTFELYEPARIQYILGLIGFNRLNERNRLKLDHARRTPDVRRTRFFETAPFLITGSTPPRGRRKPSYARFNQPLESLRPDLHAIHNKGFWDS
ncbi:MAG: hypothetical protein JNN08_08260 [Bryobacterales bacterium]|nr:hypothetical protein [Bryobacterales bacterium]